MNTIDVYKEEDLLKTINGKFIVEAYRCKRIGSTVIGLCKNSSPMFCRQENDIPETECSWMQVLNNQSSILKHDGQEIEYNSICPKIAWGITAYLYYYSKKDERGNVYFEVDKNPITIQHVFTQYYNQSKENYISSNNGYYKSCQSREKTDEFDKEFLEFHILQEQKLILKTESHIQNKLIEIAKEYIEYLNIAYAELKKKAPESLDDLFKPSVSIMVRKAFIERIKDTTKGYEIIAEILSLQDLGFIREISKTGLTKIRIRELITPYTKWNVNQSTFNNTFLSSKIKKELIAEIKKIYLSLK